MDYVHHIAVYNYFQSRVEIRHFVKSIRKCIYFNIDSSGKNGRIRLKSDPSSSLSMSVAVFKNVSLWNSARKFHTEALTGSPHIDEQPFAKRIRNATTDYMESTRDGVSALAEFWLGMSGEF